MYITTKDVTAMASSSEAPRLFVSLSLSEGKPDKGPETIGLVCGDSKISDENIIINNTNTFVTLLASDSWPAVGMKGDGPEGSGR